MRFHSGKFSIPAYVCCTKTNLGKFGLVLSYSDCLKKSEIVTLYRELSSTCVIRFSGRRSLQLLKEHPSSTLIKKELPNRYLALLYCLTKVHHTSSPNKPRKSSKMLPQCLQASKSLDLEDRNPIKSTCCAASVSMQSSAFIWLNRMQIPERHEL